MIYLYPLVGKNYLAYTIRLARYVLLMMILDSSIVFRIFMTEHENISQYFQ